MKKYIFFIIIIISIGLIAVLFYQNKINNDYLKQVPKGAEKNYQDILYKLTIKYGKSIRLLFFTSQLNFATPPVPIDIYGFISTSYGKKETFLTTYNYGTQEIDVEEAQEGRTIYQQLPLADWNITAEKAKNIAVEKLNATNITNLYVSKISLTNKLNEGFQWNVYLKPEDENDILVVINPKTGEIKSINTNYKYINN